MSNDNTDSAQTNGTDDKPKSEGSQGSGQQSSGLDVAKLQQTLDALVKRQDEIDARTKALQGDKDRGVNQTRKEVEEIKRQFAEIDKLIKSGLELDDAADEFDFRETVRSLKSQLSKLNPVSAQPAGNGASGAEDATRLIEQLKLDGNDPEVISAYTTLKGDALEAKLYKIRYRLDHKPPPSPADAPALQGGVGLANPSDEAMKAEFITKMRAVPRGTQGNEQRKALQAEYAKKGVPVYTIDFS